MITVFFNFGFSRISQIVSRWDRTSKIATTESNKEFHLVKHGTHNFLLQILSISSEALVDLLHVFQYMYSI
jgi:hypothetical protein